MSLSDEHLALLRAIQDEWNRAEQDIKTAETVVNNIVIPSVKELRYAGRRVIDALMEMTANPTACDHARIRALLDDAHFDCHRARHDAIDAATAKIAADLSIMTEKLTYGPILQAYANFPVLYQKLNSVRDKIIQSRGRRDNREAIYSVIESVDFPELVRFYNDMRTAEPMMKAIAKRERALLFYGKWGLIVGAILGVGGILVALLK